jgi:hypothetical protein
VSKRAISSQSGVLAEGLPYLGSIFLVVMTW